MTENHDDFPEPLHVSRPVLPPLESYTRLLESAWASHRLTNGGSLHVSLEARLALTLGVPGLSLTASGTTGLLLACRALGLSGEVITTPYTFAATPHAISWCGLEPVFCDIDPADLGLLPAAVEAAITPRTSAILAVHVYGIPSRLEEMERIARRHGLALIYDAAHAFGVQVDGRGIGTFGDASVYSFHATKLFHTGEGGALACRDPRVQERVDSLRNFGIAGGESACEAGLNGKMSELQAALGLAVLPRVDEEWACRATLARAWREELSGIDGITMPSWPDGVRPSHTFFPIAVDANAFGCTRDSLHDWLRSRNVMARRYFFPLCSDLPSYRDLPSSAPGLLPNAREASERYLCLPFHSGVREADVATIVNLIRCAPRAAAGVAR